jgi:hypothetical protein
VVPVSPALRARIAGPNYERAVAEAAAALALRLVPPAAAP